MIPPHVKNVITDLVDALAGWLEIAESRDQRESDWAALNAARLLMTSVEWGASDES